MKTWRPAPTSRRLEKPSQGTPTSSRAKRPPFPHAVIVDEDGEVHHWSVVLAVGRGPGSAWSGRTIPCTRVELRGRAASGGSRLDQLPAGIGLLSMRWLVPVMAALPGQLNLLTAEAVAAAVVLGARIAGSTASPHLAAAADSVDVIVDVVALD